MKKILTLLASSLLVVFSAGSIAVAAPAATHGVRKVAHTLLHGASLNWSGYAIETNLNAPQDNAATVVQGQWVVPAMTCTGAPGWSSVWVGLDGYSDNTVEQTGTEQDCQGGRAVYYTWYELYPQASRAAKLAVKAGDVVSAKVQYAAGSYVLSLTNQTTRQSFSVSKRLYGTLRQSAEWIVEAPSSFTGILPLAGFGTVAMTNASAVLNGHTGTIADTHWQYDPLTMVTNDGTVKAAPSALSASGNSFSVAWSHN